MIRSITFLCVMSLYAWGFEYGLKPQKVANGVYCFFGAVNVPNKTNNGNILNTCYVDEGTYYSVIDAGPTYKYAKEAHEKMQRIKPLKVKYLFNTHVHDDHIGGNSFYASKGVDIIGSSFLEEQLDFERMQREVTPVAYEKSQLKLPNIRMESGSKVFGNIKAIVFEPQGHTKGDMVFYHKDKGVIFVGDLVFNDRLLSLRDGSISGWISSLEAIKELTFDVMVSGHGHNVSKHAYKGTLEYLRALKRGVQKAIEEELDIDEAANSVKMESFKTLKLYEQLHKKNVYKAYQNLEWE